VISPSSHNTIKTTAIKYSITIFLSYLIFPQKIDGFYLVQSIVSLHDHTKFYRP